MKLKLVFDENIKLKNLNKQLIISPPMKNEPLILPTTVSKFITIKIKDTLQPNTTYSLNFGQSITDNNEGNPYQPVQICVFNWKLYRLFGSWRKSKRRLRQRSRIIRFYYAL